MRYYVWAADLKLEDEFAVFSDEWPGFRARPWIGGEPIAESPDFVLRKDPKSPAALSDLLLVSSVLQVCSPRLVSLLNDTGVKNVQYVPVTLINGKQQNTSYRIANLLQPIECLNMDHSKVSRSQGSGNIMSLSRFQIDAARISTHSSKGTPPLLFRLGEFKYVVLAHESIKEACEKQKITGVKFVPPEDYI